MKKRRNVKAATISGAKRCTMYTYICGFEMVTSDDVFRSIHMPTKVIKIYTCGR